MSQISERSALIEHYLQAKSWIHSSCFVHEVEWQNSTHYLQVDESEFLKQYAWVVLNSGFREAVVRKHFSYISLCFCDWESAVEIVRNGDSCVDCAAEAFGNRRKLGALVEAAQIIASAGFTTFQQWLEEDPISRLERLPYIGSVTKFHLAKNIGLDVAKPDRHLLRVASRFGYHDVQRMCRDIFEHCGDRIAVADLILWRFEERTFADAAVARVKRPPYVG